ncbi:hypothetical protein PV11_09191 [Exophiala sideris]|uniref:Uncharacterized protein n=1 Tax=Exophiala sideris TaxID=1016849 RepID=A0A0D1Y9B7_9EURO|nr:hypothetical protein PV11_09191 [Exophiala sideris]
MSSNARMLLDPKSIKKNPNLADAHHSRSAVNSTSEKTPSPQQHHKPANSLLSPGQLPPTAFHRALLDPRSSLKSTASSKSKPSPFSIAAPDHTVTDTHSQATAPVGLERQNSGPRSLLEGLYGVESRADNPRKKVKLSTTQEPTPPSKTTSYTHHPSNGIIGQYMRPDPDKSSAATLNSLVDLTNTDDEPDDDVEIVSSRTLDDQEVCYGHLATYAHAHMIPKPKHEAAFHREGEWPAMKCTLVRTPSKDTVIDVVDPMGAGFAKVDPELAMVLAPVLDGIPGLRTQARLVTRRKKPDEWAHQPCSEKLRMIVNIYGRRGDVARIGKIFGQHNLWLRPPMAPEAGIPIVNPHARKTPLPQPPRSTGQGRMLADSRTLEEATEAVSKLFDSFANAAPTLAETNPPDSIVQTPLLPHQKQALTFMLQHEQPRTFGKEESENSSLWRCKTTKTGGTVYHEVVSGITLKDEPDQVLGGLLADVMGLGKTLEALSLVGSTSEESVTFGQEKVVREDQNIFLLNTKATLIVCPTSTVQNWEDQIATHIVPQSMSYHVYHGPHRERNPYSLSKYDIVIATYGVVASEFSGRSSANASPLKQLKWFRIILDEAHTIREQRALQSQAIYSLEAQRRWCLTGTPIQNRLDDLGSLTRYLRLYPYDTAMRFNQYIRGPAQAGDPGFLKALRVFVDSFTLRRLRDRIDLPERNNLVDHLDFSPEEKRLHDFFKEIAHVQIQELARAREKNSGVQHHVLRGIMTLRLICAHGRDLLKEKDLERLKGISQSDAIDVDEDLKPPTISGRSAYESLNLMTEADLDICRRCERKINTGNTQIDSEDDDQGIRCYVLPCFDLICADCFEPEKETFDSRPDKEPVTCPYCSKCISAQYVGFSGSTAREIYAAPDDNIAEDEEDDTVHTYQGPHTKTKALLQDIEIMTEESAPLEAAGEPPLKCVVFSEFTSHLDLIEIALRDHGYSFVRIDGKMSLSNRKRAMDALASDNNIRILLASIKAAGQGLNLTAASRAFIMEPMWNPAAEAQAVDRIYRIGQKRPVLVKRYQMNDSIERKIVELQKRKQQLADVSMNQNHKQLSKQEVREQHMKDILALFK